MPVLVQTFFACDYPECGASQAKLFTPEELKSNKLEPPRGWAIGPHPNTVGYGEGPTQGCACPKHNDWLRTGEVKG